MDLLPFSQLPGMNALFLDFIENPTKVSQFYPPSDKMPPPSRPHRKKLCDILHRQNEAFGNSSSLSLIQKLERPDAYCVITGQQTGMFTGPLLTIWKALTAIKLARSFEEKEGIPCIPVFWMASEDHNLHEVMNFALLKEDYQLLQFSLHDHLFLERNPVGAIPVQSENTRKIILRVLKEIKNPEVKAFYSRGTLAETFSRTLIWILRNFPIVVVDPADPELKKLAAPFFNRVFEKSDQLLQILDRQNAALQALNYPVQVKMEENALPLFYMDGHERRHLMKNQLPENLSPEKLSPSALLRPLFQDFIFPTLTYVAGPAEIAYFAQLHPWYEALDVDQPRLRARASMTLLPPPTRSFLESKSLEPQELFYPEDTLIDALINSDELNQIKQHIHDIRQELSLRFDAMKKRAEQIEPTLNKTFETAERKMNYQLQKLERKTFFAAKRRNQILSEQIRKAKNVVYPAEKLQERYLNVFSFNTRLPDLITEVYEKMRLDATGHQWIDI